MVIWLQGRRGFLAGGMQVKPFRRFNTIFYKLIFSYSILTVLITVILGFTSYYYSSRAINGQIEKLHQKMLEHLKNVINISVLKKVDDLYIDLSVGKYSNDDIVYLFDNPGSRDYSRINNVYSYLKGLASANSDIIDSVYLYFPDQNMLLSSSFGVKFLDDQSRAAYTKTDWFDAIRSYGGGTVWVGTRKMPRLTDAGSGTADLLTYIHSYPYTQVSGTYRGFIVINIRESALSQCIRDIAPDDYNDIYILGPDGRILSACTAGLLYKDLSAEPYAQSILASSQQEESDVRKIGGVASMVSFTTLPPTGWRLVNTTSMDVFYKQSVFVQQVLVVICLSVLAFGLILSTIFTSYLYNPWKSLINGIRNMFSSSRRFEDSKYPEVEFINGIVNELSVKVHELQDTLAQNRPLIKHNLVSGLLNNHILTREQYEETVRLIPGLMVSRAHFAALLLELDPTVLSGMSMENNVFLKYNTVSNIEAMSDGSVSYLAAEYSGSVIGVIACSDEPDRAACERMFTQITNYIYSNFKIEAAAACGRWVGDILLVHESFRECLAALKYRFCLPKARLLPSEALLRREACTEPLPPSIGESFAKALNNRDIGVVAEALRAFSGEAQHGGYSAARCGEQLQTLLWLFSNYIKNMHYAFDENGRGGFREAAMAIRDVEAFEGWMTEICRDVFEFVELRGGNKNTEVVAKVKEYVSANLSRDISLDILADRIRLSAHYISKIFKEETGINLTDYITLQRIETAKRLLSGSNLTVKEVSMRVGYNNPAYFIKKFREVTGDTPLNYRKLIAN